MKKSRFTEQQIIGFLKQAESGLPVRDVCRQGGFSEPTFYKWRAKYGGMEADEARRLKDLEVENARLKKLLAEAHLDLEALKCRGQVFSDTKIRTCCFYKPALIPWFSNCSGERYPRLECRRSRL